ncbi:uncharacterized protein LOC112903527 [Panicum hallii]|uniref:uncharacterized protein LOC112903527 n=1 Tax=Panicum hallii TaxID=206008 RepID=UPI000DF4F00C|nr:uncharacterized protein LOC112903527 [Panicum hallii]
MVRAIGHGAELGAKIYGVEVDAKICSPELSAMAYGTDRQGEPLHRRGVRLQFSHHQPHAARGAVSVSDFTPRARNSSPHASSRRRSGFLVEGDEARSSHYIMTTSSGSSFPAVDLMQQGAPTPCRISDFDQQARTPPYLSRQVSQRWFQL